MTKHREIVNDKHAANVLGVTTATLRRWRKNGIGPKWLKMGGHMIRYTTEDLRDYLESCSVNTNDAAK